MDGLSTAEGKNDTMTSGCAQHIPSPLWVRNGAMGDSWHSGPVHHFMIGAQLFSSIPAGCQSGFRHRRKIINALISTQSLRRINSEGGRPSTG